ncbi:MAG: tetratricopeptide repeat protein, partial [Anaerolineae bacterium]|nr:tetratricopeptide repeat protein [Anaerolineae bacterium]
MQNLLNRLFGTQTPEPQPQLTPAQQELNTLLETAATALAQGFHDTALETYMRGLTLARTVGDTTHIEHFLSGIGTAYVSLERYDDARPYLDEALELAREINSPRAKARCLNNIGSLFAKLDQWATAQTYHQQALDAARQSEQIDVIALTLENLAQDFMHQDNPSYAQHLLKEAVVMTQA